MKEQTSGTANTSVVRTERGWAGHIIAHCANKCRFRRNTLLAYGEIKIVVSSVGLMENVREDRNTSFDTIEYNKYYETMAFHADENDKRYFNANTNKTVTFDREWSISEIDAEDKANEMHESVVAKITERLIKGDKF